MKKDIPQGVEPVSYKFISAPDDIPCDGCGEITITKGDTMMVARHNGGDERHYCLRCIFAIDCKMRHSKTGTCQVIPGSLKLANLSNVFRKRWRDLCMELIECRDRKDMDLYNAAIRRFCDDMGVNPDTIIMENLAEDSREDTSETDAKKAKAHQTYLKRKERQMKKEQDEIWRLKEELESLRTSSRKDLESLQTALDTKTCRLVKLFLAEKKAVRTGKTEDFNKAHDEAAALLVDIQKLARGDADKKQENEKRDARISRP